MIRLRLSLVFALGCCTALRLSATPAPPFDPHQAKAWFEEAHRQCATDDGRLWGVSLCGPIMFVDPATHRIMANQADAQGLLKPQDGVYAGSLPKDVPFANTAIEWGGVRWAQMGWPMPEDASQRRKLMMHESFHRIEPGIGLASSREIGSDHLDTLQGRYLMQLEWRALGQALAATDAKQRRKHAQDALVFRAARYRQFPQAAAAERAQERNEGLAEYTGIMVGGVSPAERLALAEKGLVGREKSPSFVRSFAYATGPAYGLLLDGYLPTWRQQLRASDMGLSELLAAALRYRAQDFSEQAVQTRAAAYGGPALLAGEQLRDLRHKQQVAKYKAQLIDGPLLLLPMRSPSFSFDPNTLVAFGDAGTVYPAMQAKAEWGAIEVREGALLSPDWSRLTVAAPKHATVRSGTLEGQGWTLSLAKGWHIVASSRAGDMIVVSDADRQAH
jgi:hypothetical protein